MRYSIIWYLLAGIILLFPFSGVEGQALADVRYTVDKVLPVVYCINGLAINFTEEDRVRTISAREINLGSFDNIGIKNLKIEKHRSGTTAPTSAAMDKMKFTAKDLGKHKIDLWVEDFGGNWASKSTYIIVSDLYMGAAVEVEEVSATNYPNPFSDRTQISFEMCKAGLASIAILNNRGGLIKATNAIYPKGRQVVEINKSDLPAAGVYYYQITTDQGTITKNMIMVNY